MNRRLILPLLIFSAPVLAHEVHHHVASASVRVVTLSYADGKPFAYGQFEVTPQGSEIPFQVGRSDALGRIAVLPAGDKPLTLKASSKDGHGLRLELPPQSPSASATAPATAPTMPRWLIGAVGAALLFGCFGVLQLFSKRRNAP